MKQIDLHVHSTCSDGTDSPAVLVDKAVDKGLAAFALTDHDTTMGVKEVKRKFQFEFYLPYVSPCISELYMQAQPMPAFLFSCILLPLPVIQSEMSSSPENNLKSHGMALFHCHLYDCM